MATTKYQIVTFDSWRVIERSFSSWTEAYERMLMIDNVKYENEGGLTVRPYTV